MIHGRLIAIAALAACAVLPTAAQADTPRLNGRIAYASDDALIHTAEGDGTRIKTAFDRVAGAPWSTLQLRDPAYSPDGRKLAFTAESNDASRIGVIAADRHQGVPVTVAESGAALRGLQHPSWSPDGKKLVFRALGADWGLYTVSASGGTPTKVALTAKEPAEPVYSPDGRLLAFSALDANNDRRVYLKNLETEQVTQLTSGGSEQAYPAFSADGASVAYVNTPLAPGGGDGRPQIAVRPVGGGAQDILWSDDARSALGRPAFSPDGKRIAFAATSTTCDADVLVVNLDSAPNPRAIGCSDQGAVDWAVRTAQGVVKLASALPGSDREGGDASADAAITAAGGRYSVFTSAASNLDSTVPDVNAKSDVFVRDLVRGDTELISVTGDEKAANGASDLPVISSNGNWVAFRSTAKNVQAGFEGGATAVWLRDRLNGDTRLVSRNLNRDNIGPSGDNRPVAITPEGRYVLFASTSDDVIGDPQGENAGDTDVDLFRYDTWNNKTEVVTLKTGTLFQAASGETGRAFMSADGNTVVFESTARDLVPGFVDNNGDAPSIFRRDIATGGITALVDGKLGSPTESSEAAGRLNGVSADGRTVLFQTAAKDIVANFADGNGEAADLYVRGASTGAALITTAGVAADHGANGAPGTATISANGTRVFFSSTATDLNGDYTVAGEQAWVRTLPVSTPAVLLTRGTRRPGHGANGASSVIDASADGAFALISSDATDLTAPLGQHDVKTLYRVDTATAEAEPVSARGDDSNDAAPAAQRGAMSADGNTIAWTTRAANLVDGFIDGNGADAGDAFAWIERSTAAQDPLRPTVEINTPHQDQLFRQDTVVLADYECADEGPSGLASCEGTVPAGTPLDFSDTGSFTFTVTARDNAGNETVKRVSYRVASANKKLALASRSTADRLTTANDRSFGPAFSADGRYLVFTSGATNLITGFIDGNGFEDADVYRRDMNTGITELVSAGLPRAGDEGRPRGANADSGADGGASIVSPDGRYVLFESAATNLIAGMTAPVGTQLYLRDMQAGVTKLVTHNANGLPGGDAEPNHYAFSRDGKTVVFIADAPALVANDTNGTDDVFTYSLETGAVTLVSVETSGRFPGNDTSSWPRISADGRRVVFTSEARNLLPTTIDSQGEHTFWRDLDTGVTKLVDRKWDKADEPVKEQSARGAQISADGKVVLFGSAAANIVEGFGGVVAGDIASQVYLRDMTTDGPATLVSAAWNGAKVGTGARLEEALLNRDGSIVIWNSLSKGVIENFVDHNEDYHPFGETASDLYIRRFAGATPTGPATLAVHGRDGANHGMEFPPEVRAIADNDRFVTIYKPRPFCDCNRFAEDVARLDLKRNRVNYVVSEANHELWEIAASADGRRIALTTEANNLLSGFVDANGVNAEDVFAWYDAPPVAAADSRVTGSLKLRFDASESADSDGAIERFEWDFGDGTTGTGEQAEHTYADENGYTVKLTIEDDGGNEVVHSFEVVALKGILTTGAKPVDFIGVDKHLRCSVLRDGALFAKGSGFCGTFVALGGKTYGPPELIDGTTDYTPLSQVLSSEGDVTTLVTVVGLGDTGVQVRQTDAYAAGKAWYRTDVELVNAGDDARSATVYRTARCAIAGEMRAIHDAATEMAGCAGAQVLAALLPLSPGARRDAGAADAVLGRIAAGAPLADTCACGPQADPAAAIGWPVDLAGKGTARLGSLAAFGPDGSIPLTFALAADKAEVQPLDDNAFTVTVHNPNAGEKTLREIAVVHEAAWDVIPGSTTGLTTANPAVEGDLNTWSALKLDGHTGGTLRFGVTHRSGQRTAKTTATPGGPDTASLASTSLASMSSASVAVTARSIGTSKPNTAITTGPTGMTTTRDPEFKLEASKEDGIHYECRFGTDAWAPCEGNPHRPGPLADGPYTLEARAVDAVGADETPARRTFIVDTAAPNTTISSGPRGLISDNRPGFFFGSSEAGSRFECRLGAAWFACEAPTWRPSPLADGSYTFEVRAIDAAGNADLTPASISFTLDTTPPVTVIDGITAKVLGTSRNGAAPTTTGGGSNVAVGGDGAAALAVSCPAGGAACDGTVGLATEGSTASAAQARPVPSNTIVLASVAFSAQPGQTVNVRLPLSVSVRNTLDRVGRMAVFTTIDLGSGRATRGGDVVLTPDPRAARLLDAGNEVKVKKGKAKLRLVCAAACKGTVKVGSGKAVKFSRPGSVRVPVRKAGKEVAVLIKTRSAADKRLTLTLRAQEARR